MTATFDVIFKRPNSPNDFYDMAENWISYKHSKDFLEASLEWFNTDEPGEIFIILEPKYQQPIGIIGWSPCGEIAAFMRWHSISPLWRGSGYSAVAIQKLKNRLVCEYGIGYLYELSDSEKARDHFLKNGFKIVENENDANALRAAAGNFKYVMVSQL